MTAPDKGGGTVSILIPPLFFGILLTATLFIDVPLYKLIYTAAAAVFTAAGGFIYYYLLFRRKNAEKRHLEDRLREIEQTAAAGLKQPRLLRKKPGLLKQKR